jgi:F420-dependent oxidoreductase-like protein
MRVCLMVEGQEDVTWSHWLSLARACEDYGFEALFRSDHYLSVQGQHDRGSLDAWATLAALAPLTTTLRLGTLVSPATFRHPSVLAKMVVTVDHASGGRVELGLGAGWLEAEHRAYGFPFAPVGERFDVLAEQLDIIHRSWTEGPFSFQGEHYAVKDLDALPKPLQKPHPPLIMGGNAGPRAAALAARWADEYNTVYATLDQIRERRARIAAACEEAGREPIPFSLMTGFVIGADAGEVAKRARALGQDPDALPEGWVCGTPDQVVERLGELEEAGVERVMLQHLAHTDDAALELLGREVLPRCMS